MQPSGLKETQLNDDDNNNNNQKVHPQPMEQQQQQSINQNPEAMEALISNLFGNISSLKSAYIQLQSAHTPYDPDKIQEADKVVISELKNLSELKHLYRENNPKPVCVSPQDSRLAAEIQEQQSLLKTYEVMVKKFQSEIQNKDSEIKQMMEKIEEANQKRLKLEKNLKLRGMGDGGGMEFPDLTVELFMSTYEAAAKAVHDFSKPLINMMKAAGWDLDSAAESIEHGVEYVDERHFRDDAREQFAGAVGDRAHQHAAGAAAMADDALGARIFGLDQRARCRGEIVKRVGLLLAFAVEIPAPALVGAAANMGDGVDEAAVDQRQAV